MLNAGKKKPYTEYSQFLRERYGCRVYRIPIDLGLGCPHRKVDGSEGCSFCGDFGARAMHLQEKMSLAEQVHAGVGLAKKRYGAEEFIAYFQAYTSTNASVDVLREKFSAVLSQANFRGITVSTRPDCLPNDILDYFSELAANYDFWVELGVQTASDDTLVRINRGHCFADSVSATLALVERRISVAAHIILGLPGENGGDFRRTAFELGKLPLSGIKIHNLHVLTGTALAMEWQAGKVLVWDEHEYAEVLIDFLRYIPRDWAIMRLISESPKRCLLAPHWWLSKGQFIQYVERQMLERGIVQGDRYGEVIEPNNMVDLTATVRLPVENIGVRGKDSPFKTKKLSPDDLLLLRDASVSDNSFVRGILEIANFPRLIKKRDISVLDIGFGHGIAVFGAIEKFNPLSKHKVRVIGIGWSPAVFYHLKKQLTNHGTLLKRLQMHNRINLDWGKMLLYWGDPRRQIFRMRGQADVIIIESHNYEKHIDIFSLDFLKRLVGFLSKDGIIISSLNNNSLRNSLLRLGLAVGKCDPKLVPGGGTVATWNEKNIKYKLSKKDKKLLENTLSSVPYRDLSLTWSKDKIFSHRQRVVERLKSHGWIKRLKF